MGTSGAFRMGWRAGLRRRNGLRPLEESAPSVESGVQGIQETEYAVGIEPANREGPMGDNAGWNGSGAWRVRPRREVGRATSKNP